MKTSEYKRCWRCKGILPVEYFSKCSKENSGLSGECKGCQRKKNRDRDRKLKEEVLGHYSGFPIICKRCKIDDIRVLTLDHINSDGAEHRKEVDKTKMYRWAKKNKFPAMFQVLCMNCQFIKKHECNEFNKGRPIGQFPSPPPEIVELLTPRFERRLTEEGKEKCRQAGRKNNQGFQQSI
jgi:hypothetical protein